jgi:hypothetical protein
MATAERPLAVVRMRKLDQAHYLMALARTGMHLRAGFTICAFARDPAHVRVRVAGWEGQAGHATSERAGRSNGR